MKIIHDFVEGGQTWAHRFRMFRQVLKLTVVLSFLVGMLTFSVLMLSIPQLHYQAAWYHFKAKTHALLGTDVEVESTFWKTISRERQRTSFISPKTVIYSTASLNIAFEKALIENLKKASFCFLYSLGGVMLFFFIRGATSQHKKHISGRKIAKPWRLSLKLQFFGKASPIRIGKVPLVKGTEAQHILITGGTGTGKTNCLFHLLAQIRNQNQKAIIIDTTRAFVNRFYRDTDFLLNPFDSKGLPWHPWIECRDSFDYESLAESFIPQTHHEQENYWRQAAKSLFNSVLQRLSVTQKTSEVVRWILFEPLANLCQFVQGTKAAAHMDLSSEKTAGSIRSVTSAFVECLDNLKDTACPFSIRQWIENENSNSWLFIQCTPAQRAAINPLITSWISVAVRSLLGLSPNLNRRVWFILDELASLNKVRNLETLLTEGRKYGGCGVLAIQSLAQLESIYGRENSKTIIGNCLTKIVFAEQDPEIAEKISKMFGEREVKECQEGISYGAHETRDGVNLSSQKKQIPVISSTEVQSLEKNNAFLKLPGKHPIAKIKLPIE